jgi:hypothetical protein
MSKPKRKASIPNVAAVGGGSNDPHLQPSLDLLDPNTTPKDVAALLLSLLPAGAKHDAAAKKLVKALPVLTAELDARSNAMAKDNESEGAHHPIAFQFQSLGTTSTANGTSNIGDDCDSCNDVCGDEATVAATPTTTAIQMPEECFVKMMGFLNGREIVQLSTVNKAWLYISRMPELWVTLDAINGLSNKARRMTQKTLTVLLERPQFVNLRSLTLPMKVKLGKTTIKSIAKSCPLLETWNVGYGRDTGRGKDSDLEDAAEEFTKLTSIRTNLWDVTAWGIISVAKVMGTRLLDLRIDNDCICNHYLNNGVLTVISEHCPNLRFFAYKMHSMFYKGLFDWLTGAGVISLVGGCRRLEVLELENVRRIERADFVTILSMLDQDPGSFALRKIDLVGYPFVISGNPLAIVDNSLDE